MPHDSEIAIALVLPDLLGTYGDTGNAQVLARRARWRGLPCRVIRATSDHAVPIGCDIYLLGGGENDAQAHAVQLLDRGGFRAAVSGGAAVLAVCAGMQLLGVGTTDADGRTYPGLGLLDLSTVAGRRRAIGPIVTDADPDMGLADAVLVGFENHAGRTTRAAGLAPLGHVRSGTGNGDRTDGVLAGRIIGTYLHGPVLARNPALADHLLSMVTGYPLPPLLLPDVPRMRRSALTSARALHGRWTRRREGRA